MKKTLLYLLIASIFLHAESLDEEIEKLKKENELLELKQKNKQLSQDLQDGKVTNDTTNTNASDNTPIIKTSKEESKNGSFIGLEGAIGINATFDGGLLLGSQRYFGQTQRHGIKLSSHLYSGFGYSYTGYGVDVSLIPIKVGSDLKYLWDFWDNKKHILGFNAGVGLQLDYYLGKFSYSIGNTRYESEYDIIGLGFYPTIGLHYIYNRHHQFELNYRYYSFVLGYPTFNYSFVQGYFTLSYAYRFNAKL